MARTDGGFGANLTWDETIHIEYASIDLASDGSYEISHVRTITPGSSATCDASEIGLSTASPNVATNNNSEVRVEVQYREVTQTEKPTVKMKGQQTRELGKLTDDETVQVNTDPSWINSGTNRINVSLRDGTLSADAPSPRLASITRTRMSTTRPSSTRPSAGANATMSRGPSSRISLQPR